MVPLPEILLACVWPCLLKDKQNKPCFVCSTPEPLPRLLLPHVWCLPACNRPLPAFNFCRCLSHLTPTFDPACLLNSRLPYALHCTAASLDRSLVPILFHLTYDSLPSFPLESSSVSHGSIWTSRIPQQYYWLLCLINCVNLSCLSVVVFLVPVFLSPGLTNMIKREHD